MKKNKYLRLILTLLLVNASILSIAQVPTCGSDVPFYQVNLTGNPNGTWYSPAHERLGNCCNTTSPDKCTSFEVTLDTATVMIQFDIVAGAIPSGAMFYQINCGPQIPVGDPICISGVGPHHITFCKPGNNENVYMIHAISKPLFPLTQHVRIGCSQTISVAGVDTATLAWTSIYPGATGQYNNFLSCTTGCANPLFSPDSTAPSYIDYLITGTPVASACGYVSVADTLRVYIYNEVIGSVTPNPAAFCANTGGIQLTASGSGGYGQYTFIWRDTSGTIIGTNPNYYADSTGMYFVEIRDELYVLGTCPATFLSVPVIETNIPAVNAGADQNICTANPVAYLNGSAQNSPGVQWIGGAGTFSPDNTNLFASYVPNAAELAAGSVTLVLTTTGVGGGCSNASDTVVLFFPPPLSVNMSSVNADCNNSTATLGPNVSGGMPPYTFNWSTGSTAMNINAPQGNYCVSVTDNMGCFTTVCANIIAPAPLNISMGSTPVSSDGGSDGTATATVSGGVGPYSYSWNPGGQNTSSISGLSYGVYTVTVTDSRGCTIQSSIVVNEPRCSSFSGTITKNDVTCYGGNNGSATVTASGGAAPYTYLWDDPSQQTTPTADNLSAGIYMVVVTDTNGCLFSAGISIFEPPQLTNFMNQTNVTTLGGSDGTATSNPFGGTPGYTFAWNNGGTSQTITNLSQGTYILTLTDANGCSLIDSVIINDAQCNTFVVAANITNVSCFGENDGSISISALHGTAPYTYSWNTGSNSSSISNLSTGTYMVTVTDALNCVIFKNITVVQPAPLSITLAPTNVSCYNAYDGAIEMTVYGGTFPFYYNWSNGTTVEDLIDLGPGSFSVTVTDDHGCTTNASATVTSPTQIVVSSNITNAICNGTKGSIDVTVSGGVIPYGYAWSNGSTTEDLIDVPATQYFFTVTDNNGCSVSPVPGFLIDQPDSVDIGSEDVDCPVPGSGVAQVTVTPIGGSNGPYQISFDNGATYQSVGDYDAILPVGATYTVMVKDSNGCTSPQPKEIEIKPEVTFTLTYDKCFSSGNASSTIVITPAGGKSPYSVSLDGGITYQAEGDYSFNVPINGTYDIIVKDKKNCVSQTMQITVPDFMTLTSSLSDYNGYNISCAGATDGSIDLTLNGGTTPYSYAWSNGSTTQDLNNIGSGTYNVLVTDANGCTKNLSVIISEPNTFTVSLASLTDFNGYDISCYGMDDGAIDLGVNGGSLPYSYSWSNGDSTQDLIKLTAGQYTVQVTDANNCKTYVSITLTEPPALSSTITSLNNNNGYETSCNGEKDGKIDLQVNGGVTTYTFVWNNGATTEDLNDVGAGTYSVTITDQNNCTTTASIQLTEPPQLVASVTGTSSYNGFNITCNGMNDGTIDITVSGGVAAYNYNWSNGTGTEDLSGLTAGSYSITVTDANGCTTDLNVSLSEPIAINSAVTPGSDYNGFEISCNGMSDGAANLQVNGGVLPYSYMWSNGNLVEDISGIPAGTYSVTITDANNCSVNATIDLSEPPQLSATAISVNDYNGYQIRCNGMNDGMIDITVSGGVATYTYAWSNGEISEDLSSLGIGTYSVTVTDMNNCSASASLLISEPPALATNYSLSDYNGYNISCSGLSDGSVDLNVSGGVAQYYYSWTNGAATEDLSSVSAGTYSVSITDANGCSVIHTINLGEPDALSSFALATTNFNGYQVSCFGSSDANIDLNTTGGVSPLTYQWSNDANTEDLSGLTAGIYSVTITDLNNCITTTSITISEPPALQSTLSLGANYNGYGVSCHGMSDGALDLEVTGGTGAYTYSWNNGTITQDLTEIPAGTYTVVITDENNCTRTATLTVTEPAELSSEVSSISQYNSYNISCKGKSDGAIDAMTAGGVLGYTYTWSNGASTEDVNLVTAGTYSLVVTDANNCFTTISVTLTEPEALTTAASSSDFNGYSVSCYGSLDGSIDLNVNGGTGVYSYSWSNGSVKEDVSSLSAGTYSVIVTDVNTCSDTLIFNLTQPDSVQVNATIKHVPCNGFSNGSIDLTISGGVNDYTYNWTTDAITEDVTDLQSGTYSVIITDKNNCITEKIYTITETTPLLVNISQNNASCSGELGSATIEVMGGTPGYTYTWSNGSGTPVQENLSPGTYDVTIVDANKCTKTGSVTITEPAVLSSAITASLFYNGYNVSGYDESDGSIDIAVNGGTAPYTYTWSNGSDEEDLSNVSAGLYVVQITDSNGCTLIDSAQLNEPYVLDMPTGFSPNSDGNNDYFVVRGIENYPDNVILIYNRWGAKVFEQDDYKNTWTGKTTNGSDLPEGTYFVILKLNNGPTLTGYVDLRR